MKVVYVDSSIVGHHVPYIKTLSCLADEAVAVLPGKIDNLKIAQYKCEFPDSPKRKLSEFLKWNRAVEAIVETEKPDIVHFLMGDDYYRFFGMGLGYFSKYKTVVTLHWTRNGIIGKASTKQIARGVDCVVMHSDYLKRKLNSCGIKNVMHIEYPQFGTFFYEKKEARNNWNLDPDIPVIACIGNTRYDKGLDILLEALGKVDKPFQLLVAGKATHFGKAFIEEKISAYKDKVHLYLNYLTDDELASAVSAADIVTLPYRKVFNGASGPLGDGVVHSKMIIGPNHGNLGDTIEKNHLGYTFVTESVDSLAETINHALSSEWKQDEIYMSYQELLTPERFQEGYMRLYKRLMAL